MAVDLGVVCVKQTDGRTPLHAASERGHVEAVVALVGAGAAVNQAMVSADGGARDCLLAWGARVLWCCGVVRGECVVMIVGLHVMSDGCGLGCVL
jgi:hypothetical protein